MPAVQAGKPLPQNKEINGFQYACGDGDLSSLLLSQYGCFRQESPGPTDGTNLSTPFGIGQPKRQSSKLATARTTTISTTMLDRFNIRVIGMALFVLASIFCLYEIWAWRISDKPQHDAIEKRHYTGRLKMVNIFNRHGDRAPSDGMPIGDRHAEMVEFFWPNGSPIYRCQESLELILRGLYNTEWTTEHGRYLPAANASGHHCLPSGSGSADEWKRIAIDTETVPSLTWSFLNDCAFRKKNPSPVDKDLTASKAVKSLVGIEQLRSVLWQTYQQELNFTSLGLWSTIVSEMNLVRTEATLEYARHYLDWVNTPISALATKNNTNSTRPPLLFDLYEHATVLGYRDRIIADEANYIQTGPLITSLIESQMVALGRNATNSRMQMYKDKLMVLYSTHDSILQVLLHNLGLIRYDDSLSLEKRFARLHKNADDLEKFLAGLTMSSYGASVRFELWELQARDGGKDTKSFPYVQVSIYNRNEVKFQNINYKPVELGSACRRLFIAKYPGPRGISDLAQFYDSEFRIDSRLSCPFELLRNLTSELMIDDERMRQLCETN